jgi:hypothetical protein
MAKSHRRLAARWLFFCLPLQAAASSRGAAGNALVRMLFGHNLALTFRNSSLYFANAGPY